MNFPKKHLCEIKDTCDWKNTNWHDLRKKVDIYFDPNKSVYLSIVKREFQKEMWKYMESNNMTEKVHSIFFSTTSSKIEEVKKSGKWKKSQFLWDKCKELAGKIDFETPCTMTVQVIPIHINICAKSKTKNLTQKMKQSRLKSLDFLPPFYFYVYKVTL